ncbi:MAG: ATP-binding cassette domain-containing protein [Clostridia bacterium]|nr:ATP-binding cassette domain-containing protein [Clostridia bacterium]
MSNPTPVIELNHVSKVFRMKTGFFSLQSAGVKAVDDVSLAIHKGEIVGLVGESGSGKTTLARMVLGLIKPTSGQILIDGEDTAHIGRGKMKEIRQRIAVVFQDPASNLNPKHTVGDAVMRPLLIRGLPKKEMRERAEEAMDKVRMSRKYLESYPHQLSGGQLQRIAIARALVTEPRIMILDEPTSALDISIQAQILNLLIELQRDTDLTYLIISHDLNVIKYVSDRIAVMYQGKLVEYGACEEVAKAPRHPYTRGLLAAAPVIHPALRGEKTGRLKADSGDQSAIGDGCPLYYRCSLADSSCLLKQELREIADRHFAACAKAE